MEERGKEGGRERGGGGRERGGRERGGKRWPYSGLRSISCEKRDSCGKTVRITTPPLPPHTLQAPPTSTVQAFLRDSPRTCL